MRDAPCCTVSKNSMSFLRKGHQACAIVSTKSPDLWLKVLFIMPNTLHKYVTPFTEIQITQKTATASYQRTDLKFDYVVDEKPRNRLTINFINDHLLNDKTRHICMTKWMMNRTKQRIQFKHVKLRIHHSTHKHSHRFHIHVTIFWHTFWQTKYIFSLIRFHIHVTVFWHTFRQTKYIFSLIKLRQ